MQLPTMPCTRSKLGYRTCKQYLFPIPLILLQFQLLSQLQFSVRSERLVASLVSKIACLTQLTSTPPRPLQETSGPKNYCMKLYSPSTRLIHPLVSQTQIHSRLPTNSNIFVLEILAATSYSVSLIHMEHFLMLFFLQAC